MLGTMYEINFYKYNVLHAIFFILLLSFADLFINILLFEQFFPKHHQSIKLFKNPDFVSPYLGPKCLQRLSADDRIKHSNKLQQFSNLLNCKSHFSCTNCTQTVNISIMSFLIRAYTICLDLSVQNSKNILPNFK